MNDNNKVIKKEVFFLFLVLHSNKFNLKTILSLGMDTKANGAPHSPPHARGRLTSCHVRMSTMTRAGRWTDVALPPRIQTRCRVARTNIHGSINPQFPHVITPRFRHFCVPLMLCLLSFGTWEAPTPIERKPDDALLIAPWGSSTRQAQRTNR